MSEIKKLSDLTGNPWDDLTAQEQADAIFVASKETYEMWMNPPKHPTTGEVYGRICADRVRAWDAFCDIREQARKEMEDDLS